MYNNNKFESWVFRSLRFPLGSSRFFAVLLEFCTVGVCCALQVFGLCLASVGPGQNPTIAWLLLRVIRSHRRARPGWRRFPGEIGC